MKIAITGAHSTGKSTLVEALMKDEELRKEFEFRGNITRGIKSQGININELGTDESQLLVLSKHLENYIPTDVILDRCALDGLVYTAYLYEKKAVQKNTLRIAESIFENLKYDIICYIPPEFSIVADHVRSTNPEFRDRIVELFEEYIESYNIAHIRITGSVEDRAKQVKKLIRDSQNFIKESIETYKQPLRIVVGPETTE